MFLSREVIGDGAGQHAGDQVVFEHFQWSAVFLLLSVEPLNRFGGIWKQMTTKCVLLRLYMKI